jgi:hypothetical protein
MLNVRTQWPWISMLLAAIAALNSVGRDVIYAAFLSNEALSRNIWGSIALTGMAITALIVLSEWRIRAFIINRRARSTTIT